MTDAIAKIRLLMSNNGDRAMDSQTLINAAFGIIAFLGGWVLNSLKESMKTLHDSDTALTTKVQAIEVLVAGSYVKRDDLDKLTHALFNKLDVISDKLDNKVSKDDCQGCSSRRSP